MLKFTNRVTAPTDTSLIQNNCGSYLTGSSDFGASKASRMQSSSTTALSNEENTSSVEQSTEKLNFNFFPQNYHARNSTTGTSSGTDTEYTQRKIGLCNSVNEPTDESNISTATISDVFKWLQEANKLASIYSYQSENTESSINTEQTTPRNTASKFNCMSGLNGGVDLGMMATMENGESKFQDSNMASPSSCHQDHKFDSSSLTINSSSTQASTPSPQFVTSPVQYNSSSQFLPYNFKDRQAGNKKEFIDSPTAQLCPELLIQSASTTCNKKGQYEQNSLREHTESLASTLSSLDFKSVKSDAESNMPWRGYGDPEVRSLHSTFQQVNSNLLECATSANSKATFATHEDCADADPNNLVMQKLCYEKIQGQEECRNEKGQESDGLWGAQNCPVEVAANGDELKASYQRLIGPTEGESLTTNKGSASAFPQQRSHVKGRVDNQTPFQRLTRALELEQHNLYHNGNGLNNYLEQSENRLGKLPQNTYTNMNAFPAYKPQPDDTNLYSISNQSHTPLSDASNTIAMQSMYPTSSRVSSSKFLSSPEVSVSSRLFPTYPGVESSPNVENSVSMTDVTHAANIRLGVSCEKDPNTSATTTTQQDAFQKASNALQLFVSMLNKMGKNTVSVGAPTSSCPSPGYRPSRPGNSQLNEELASKSVPPDSFTRNDSGPKQNTRAANDTSSLASLLKLCGQFGATQNSCNTVSVNEPNNGSSSFEDLLQLIKLNQKLSSSPSLTDDTNVTGLIERSIMRLIHQKHQKENFQLSDRLNNKTTPNYNEDPKKQSSTNLMSVLLSLCQLLGSIEESRHESEVTDAQTKLNSRLKDVTSESCYTSDSVPFPQASVRHNDTSPNEVQSSLCAARLKSEEQHQRGNQCSNNFSMNTTARQWLAQILTGTKSAHEFDGESDPVETQQQLLSYLLAASKQPPKMSQGPSNSFPNNKLPYDRDFEASHTYQNKLPSQQKHEYLSSPELNSSTLQASSDRNVLSYIAGALAEMAQVPVKRAVSDSQYRHNLNVAELARSLRDEGKYAFDAQLRTHRPSPPSQNECASGYKNSNMKKSATEYLCTYPGVSWNTRMQSWLVYYEDARGRKSRTFNPKRLTQSQLEVLPNRIQEKYTTDPVEVAMHCACVYAARVRWEGRLRKSLGFQGSRNQQTKNKMLQPIFNTPQDPLVGSSFIPNAAAGDFDESRPCSVNLSQKSYAKSNTPEQNCEAFSTSTTADNNSSAHSCHSPQSDCNATAQQAANAQASPVLLLTSLALRHLNLENNSLKINEEPSSQTEAMERDKMGTVSTSLNQPSATGTGVLEEKCDRGLREYESQMNSDLSKLNKGVSRSSRDSYDMGTSSNAFSPVLQLTPPSHFSPISQSLPCSTDQHYVNREVAVRSQSNHFEDRTDSQQPSEYPSKYFETGVCEAYANTPQQVKPASTVSAEDSTTAVSYSDHKVSSSHVQAGETSDERSSLSDEGEDSTKSPLPNETSQYDHSPIGDFKDTNDFDTASRSSSKRRRVSGRSSRKVVCANAHASEYLEFSEPTNNVETRSHRRRIPSRKRHSISLIH